MPHAYTDEEKALALDAYREVGPVNAAVDTGIGLRTIFRWASEAGLTSYAEDEKQRESRVVAKRGAIRELLLDRVLEMLMRMDGPMKASDMRQTSIAIGTLIDKYRLEMGEATARTYHEGRDDIDRAVSQLVEELQRSDQTSA